MVYENIKRIYGPYKSKKDSRLRIILYFNDGTKRLISYPKYLMEKHINRYLDKDETIDHIDGDVLNNCITNLQILNRVDHSKLDAIRNKDVEVNCKYCNTLFIIKGSNLRERNRKDRHSSGYFCSRSCSGKYGKEIQLGKRLHVPEERIQAIRFKLKEI